MLHVFRFEKCRGQEVTIKNLLDKQKVLQHRKRSPRTLSLPPTYSPKVESSRSSFIFGSKAKLEKIPSGQASDLEDVLENNGFFEETIFQVS